VSQDTRGRIVDAAIQLFNERGVAAVTTNHVAGHLKISPGNLYYHFRNKEEIVREAFDRMNAEADEVWRLESTETSADTAKPPAVDPMALQRMLVGNLKLYARYLFFTSVTPPSPRSASTSSSR